MQCTGLTLNSQVPKFSASITIVSILYNVSYIVWSCEEVNTTKALKESYKPSLTQRGSEALSSRRRWRPWFCGCRRWRKVNSQRQSAQKLASVQVEDVFLVAWLPVVLILLSRLVWRLCCAKDSEACWPLHDPWPQENHIIFSPSRWKEFVVTNLLTLFCIRRI